MLAPHRELILVDLPGHGQSPPLPHDERTAAEALISGVADLLDDLGMDHPHIGGSSLGGRIALELAVQGRAATVTAFSPAGFWNRPGELRYIKTVFWAMQHAGQALEPAAPVLARSTAGRAVLYAGLASKPSHIMPIHATSDLTAFLAAKPAMRAILDEASPFTDLIAPDVPVMIAWGTRDLLLRPRQAEVAKARIPHARVIPLPGCGHLPMSDNPQLVAKVLLAGSRTAAVDREPETFRGSRAGAASGRSPRIRNPSGRLTSRLLVAMLESH
jgi:pimeloyl-ACP methyl ester carboxylesterase